MELIVLSSNAYLERLIQQRGKAPFLGAQPEALLVTRDWFVMQRLKALELPYLILENHLSVEEVGVYSRELVKQSKSWYLDERGVDFSLYRGISLADSCVQYFAHVYSNILNLVPNLLKIIDRYRPARVVYEDHVSYRNSPYFEQEHLLFQAVCRDRSVGYERLLTEEFNDVDRGRCDYSCVFTRSKNNLLAQITFPPLKGMILDCLNAFHAFKYKFFLRPLRPKKTVFSDFNRGVGDFCEAFRGNYNFIHNRRIKSAWQNVVGTSLVFKSWRKPRRKGLQAMLAAWEDFLGKKTFSCAGIDVSQCVTVQLRWAVENLFPRLRELIDKASRAFSFLKVDAVVMQSDSVLETRYLFSLLKKMGIKNFVHPDGPRYEISCGIIHAQHVLHYSEGTRRDYENEKIPTVNEVVGNPPYQRLYAASKPHRGRWNPSRPLRVLVAAKNEGPWLIGNYLSSSFDYLDKILQGLKPLANDVKITVRNNPGIDNHLDYLRRNYFADVPFDIQDALQVPFIRALQEADVFIGKPSTTVFEAAIMGKPVIYYCNNNQWYFAPFDAASELKTVTSPDELTRLMKKVLSENAEELLVFSKKEVLEKYTGPLEESSSVELMRRAIEAHI